MGPEIGNVFTNLITLFKNMDKPDSDTQIKLSVGQIIKAQVLSKEGDLYLLQNGDKRFFAKAENSLEPGQIILLEVLGNKEENIVMKRVEGILEKKDENAFDPVKQLMKKFGINTEKDLLQVQHAIKDIPCEPTIATRYLLDPHLLTALLLPSYLNEDEYNRIEVNCYKSAQSNQDIFEVSMELELSQLGHIEITVKSIENNIYTRIWADVQTTEEILKSKIEEIQDICPRIELIPARQGPLIVRDIQKKVDVRI
ncbi:MAG: hypothetical protein CVU87_02315 [Firmicutes bacterium HGW-Firmicutes-12]|jgi:hypothetical protein|nr:MAG: hypothetical protein CVU87_02315 [Firmicutes bacterium HGW-Firmicutes-12]